MYNAIYLEVVTSRFAFDAVTGHGIDEQLIKAVFRQNKAFFDLPLEEKLKIKVSKHVRGYTAREVSRLFLSSSHICMPTTTALWPRDMRGLAFLWDSKDLDQSWRFNKKMWSYTLQVREIHVLPRLWILIRKISEAFMPPLIGDTTY